MNQTMNPLHQLAASAMTPGDVVKLALRSRGLTMADVARKAGIDRSYVSRVVNEGTGSSRDAVRTAIAELLPGISVDDVHQMITRN